MRATCAKPASPLTKNAFSLNQSGKLGKADKAPSAVLFRVGTDVAEFCYNGGGEKVEGIFEISTINLLNK